MNRQDAKAAKKIKFKFEPQRRREIEKGLSIRYDRTVSAIESGRSNSVISVLLSVLAINIFGEFLGGLGVLAVD